MSCTLQDLGKSHRGKDKIEERKDNLLLLHQYAMSRCQWQAYWVCLSCFCSSTYTAGVPNYYVPATDMLGLSTRFCCGTYMAGVPFCFVPATCVYIGSVYLHTQDLDKCSLTQLLQQSHQKFVLVARSLKAWCRPAQFSKFHDVPEMTNYCEMLFFVVLFFVQMITSMPVMDLCTCRTLNTVPEQCVPLVNICSIA